MPTEVTSSATKVLLGCSKCGAALPDQAQFCLKCGKPVSIPLKSVNNETTKLVEPRRKPRIFIWILVGLLLGLICWVAISDDPFAQGLQEIVGWKHDQAVLDTPVSVSPHSFRYYKFSLPEGSVNVSIVGQFATVPPDKKPPNPKVKPEDANPKVKLEDSDNDIEVYVLPEAAFAVWQNGYATSSVYESGRVQKGELQSELPAGAGVYYLVFSNKFSTKAPKTVNATVLLRYKSWVPESIRVMKGRLLNWLGL